VQREIANYAYLSVNTNLTGQLRSRNPPWVSRVSMPAFLLTGPTVMQNSLFIV